jgi:2-polyprenyl-3-methyl-5-hydroxy-6-metoxy-1,4-benzoquinol methylase
MDEKTTQAQALASRLFTAGLAAAELLTAYLGTRLGLYEALAALGPATANGLAERAGIAPRYAREWLEQQAASGILEVDDVRKEAEDRLYILSEGHREALIESDSLFWIAPIALLPVGGMTRALPAVLKAYRDGSGVPYAEYGADFRGDQSGFNRVIFRYFLPRWIRTLLPTVHARLSAGAKVADIGCGLGWSSIALAQTYPNVTIDAFDLDEPSIGLARRNAVEAGVSNRVEFHVRDARQLDPAPKYSLMCFFDALHDMPRPVEVLRSCRDRLEVDGIVLLMEPNAAEGFTAPADDTERFLYAISVLHCLPVGLSEQPSMATGTMMRPRTTRAYATEAGFLKITTQAVDHRFYRLYCLS